MVGLLVLALVAAVVALPLIARQAVALWDAASVRRRERARAREGVDLRYDPGRERRAEQRARELLRSCVNDEEWAMYRDLGFLRVYGRPGRSGVNGGSNGGALNGRSREHGVAGGSDGRGTGGSSAPYAYLVYAHKPIVAFVPASGQFLSEYCVEFPDIGGEGRTRLPASDDVLAKWMALTSDENRVIGTANMHLVGRQHDPSRLRRDLWRLSEWDRRRGAEDDSMRARG